MNANNFSANLVIREQPDLEVLREELGCGVQYKVIDGQHFVPQHRERLLIVGFKGKADFLWDAPQLPEKGVTRLSSILHPQDASEQSEEPFTVGEKAKVNCKYTLTPKLWAYMHAYAEKYRKAGSGFGLGRLTPRRCERLMGFPDVFFIPVSDVRACRHLGNSVTCLS